MFCGNCGTENADGAVFCRNCGCRMEAEQGKSGSENISAPPVMPQQVVYMAKEGYADEYKPIGMWGYFGYELLFSIPLIGFIVLLIFAFGGTKNVNVKNFARSYFCMMIVWIIIIVLLISSGGLLAAFM